MNRQHGSNALDVIKKDTSMSKTIIEQFSDIEEKVRELKELLGETKDSIINLTTQSYDL